MVKKGFTNSSIEYNKEKEGIAININITAGIKVQIISKFDACVIISIFLLLLLKSLIHLYNKYITKNKIKVKKKNKSWWKEIIPSITGEFAFWKPNW